MNILCKQLEQLRDTILTFKISYLQKMAEKRKLDFKFYSFDNYKYEIENY